jgi:molybdopterin synthase sulfur carrier subunit
VQVEVRLFAYLRQLCGGNLQKLELSEGISVQDLIEKLNLTDEKSLIIMVNGRREEMTKLLKDGDRVGIFPPVGGG